MINVSKMPKPIRWLVNYMIGLYVLVIISILVSRSGHIGACSMAKWLLTISMPIGGFLILIAIFLVLREAIHPQYKKASTVNKVDYTNYHNPTAYTGRNISITDGEVNETDTRISKEGTRKERCYRYDKQKSLHNLVKRIIKWLK